MDNKEFLKKAAFKLLAKKNNGNLFTKQYKDRLTEELDLILTFDLEDYFLKYSYVINSFKSQGKFISPARGSSSGSLLCFILSITEVDPIKWNLSFARFLNKGRVANGQLPDIDSDISKSKRQDAIKWMKEEFGKNKVFNVVNFNRFKLKSSIKLLARVFEVDFAVVNAVTRKLDKDDTLDDLQKYPEIAAFLDKYPKVKEYLPAVNDLIQNLGVHAGGIVIMPSDIKNHMGITKVGDTLCTCWDKKIEDKGFVKLDLLGLTTLDIIKGTIDISGAKLPKEYDDQKVFDTMNKSPLGIFQIEKAAGMEYIKQAPIQSFSDLYNATALIRPGSKDTGDTAKYIERLHDSSKIEYDHENLKPVLEESKGVILFQEQQQAITRVIAGFSDTESDDIRRAIGKKKLDLMESYHNIFIDRSIERGYEEALVKLLWSKIEAAASYLFNKSHGVSYSIISYFCAYLKTYHLPEFMTMAANYSKKEKRIKVFGEMKKEGIEVKLPDINVSQEEISKIDNDIVLGLELIDGVGPKAMEDILEKRPFHSFDDFINRKHGIRVNKRVVQALIESGALDRFGKRDFLTYINETEIDSNQTDLFGSAPVHRKWTTQEMLFREYKRIKLSPNQNLIDFYNNEEISDRIEICDIAKLEDIKEGYEFYVKALISDYESKGEYGYLSVSDGEDSLSLMVSGSNKQQQYFDVMTQVGIPVLIKLHIKYGRPYLNFLINLQDRSNYQHEEDYISGKLINETLKKYIESNPSYNWGVLQAVSYFTSKAGNQCCSFRIQMNEKVILENKLICRNVSNDLKDGTIIGFFPSGADFIDIERVYNGD